MNKETKEGGCGQVRVRVGFALAALVWLVVTESNLCVYLGNQTKDVSRKGSLEEGRKEKEAVYTIIQSI